MSISKRSSHRFSPEFVLLGFLAEAPSHGYELHQRLVEQFGTIWHTSQSQTYSILKRLEAHGFIKATAIEQDKLPARQQLQLTTAGAHRFEDWLNQPTKPSVHAIRVEFITRLYFIQLFHPERAKEMVDAQAEVVKTSLSRLSDQLEKMPDGQEINRLGIALRVELLSSVDRWLERCKQAVEGGQAWIAG